MNIFTVSFFGHRDIDNPFEIESRLERIIRSLIHRKEYVDFLVGKDGEFDQIVSSTVRRTVRSCGYGNSSLILVLPYMRAEYRDNEQSYHDYYDQVEICAESSKAHFKGAIQFETGAWLTDQTLFYVILGMRAAELIRRLGTPKVKSAE